MKENQLDGNKIINTITNRLAMKIAQSESEIAFVLAENDELKATIQKLEEENKLLREGDKGEKAKK